VLGAERQVDRRWPARPDVVERLGRPRDDLVAEGAPGRGDGEAPVFAQRDGPFTTYERTVTPDGEHVLERTRYRLVVPWFGWLFAVPVRAALARRGRRPTERATSSPGAQPTWAPPDRLTPRQVLVLGLLGAASMSSAFVNTLFTQTVNFAADDFHISESGQGIAGVIVRCGIVLALPIAIAADRVGRRRMIVLVAWLAPACAALGAVAPNFTVLVATQTVGRPLGLALDMLVAVVATEEMPRNSRAYAVSVLAMASGLGAGVAVAILPVADLGASGWRLVYVATLIWLLVAADLARRLPETERFEKPHAVAPRLARGRFALIGVVAFLANVFVAPASFFQNRYLRDIRGYSAAEIAAFTLCTATPAGLGLVIGGRLADVTGRRRVFALSLPVGTTLLVMSFVVGGPAMWACAFGGGLLGGVAFPALAVYRTELFPTGNRGRAAGFVTALALVGGSLGLVATGELVDRGWSYGEVMVMLALAQVVTAAIVVLSYPETAHRDLDELNPEDRVGLSAV
jgi:MFS family permease